MNSFVDAQKESILISKDTPLISNLDMCENISLIKEVHHLISTTKAKALAMECLKKLSLEDIAFKRPTQCDDTQKFYVMFIRALMCDVSTVIILDPSRLINTLKDIKAIIENIEVLSEKSVIILDTFSNEVHYEGCSCHILR